MGYATGDDHLYLVYVYIPNGSLSDHLHDPLMKGIQRNTTLSAYKLQRNAYIIGYELIRSSASLVERKNPDRT